MEKNNMEKNNMEKNISKLGFPLGLIITKKNNNYMEKNHLLTPKIGGSPKIVLTNKGLSSETTNFSDPIKIYN
jgi:hypothetical protein